MTYDEIHKSIYWSAQKNAWNVSIRVNDKRAYLGCYKSYYDALKVRKHAEKYHGWSANHGDNK